MQRLGARSARGAAVRCEAAALAGRIAWPLAWTIACSGAAACTTPSSNVDGGDLLGVFERADAGRLDAGASGPRDGGAAGTGATKPRSTARDAGAPKVSVRARDPVEGSCVAPEGTPNQELRRTLGRPACQGAIVLESRDAEGSPRYACVFAPRGIETRAPLPLVVFFHGSEDDPTSVDKRTGLRKHGSRADLTSDPAHAGFVVLAPQGRAIKGGKLGSIFDVEHVADTNVDVATVDGFVEELAAKGWVDRRRVYALGVGSGGTMAATWAMLRADRVAAFATYASEPPRARWSCATPPPPGMVLYRACDSVVPCDTVETWLREREAMHADTPWVRLGAADEEEPSCTVRNRCTKTRGAAHHRRWPKAREDDVLRFFASHAVAVESLDAGAEGAAAASATPGAARRAPP